MLPEGFPQLWKHIDGENLLASHLSKLQEQEDSKFGRKFMRKAKELKGNAAVQSFTEKAARVSMKASAIADTLQPWQNPEAYATLSGSGPCS